MTVLQYTLNDVHLYVPLYKHAHQIMAEKPPGEQANVDARITFRPSADGRCFNLPTVHEVAAIIRGNGEENTSQHREIILRLRAPQNGSSLKMISHLNPLYSPLHYILFFPFGDLGWHKEIPAVPGEHDRVCSKHVSQCCYYAY
jgi:hypothetical protein